MSLTPEQLAARRGKLTASAIGCLISGDQEKIIDLWRELVEDPDWKRKDLSHIWPIELGNATERLNLDWYQKKTGNAVSRRGEVVTHQTVPWAAATLDGWIEALNCPVECKHVGGREPFERIIERYAAQCQWQMDVMNSSQCIFSVIVAANEPRLEVIEHNAEFSAMLWERAEKFMHMVRNLIPPEGLQPIAEVPVQIKKWRDIDFKGNNEWANEAFEWLEHRVSAKKADTAKEKLKAMVPEDCRMAIGHGIKVTRSKAGSLTLTAL